MKPFLGIDQTSDRNNDITNRAEFSVAEPNSVTADAFERSVENASQIIEQSKLPLPLRIAQGVCGIAGIMLLAGILNAFRRNRDGTISLADAYRNAPWIFWLCAGFLLAWAICKIFAVKKSNDVLSSEEGSYTLAKFDNAYDAVLAELAVPHDAKEVDILCLYYKEKDGNINIRKNYEYYINSVFRIFAEQDTLYLADIEGKYAFPLSNFTAIHTVKKSFTLMSWNKEEQFNKDRYKQFKLSKDSAGDIICRSYCIAEFEHNGTAWGIYFPCYELPIFEELLKLKAQPQ